MFKFIYFTLPITLRQVQYIINKWHGHHNSENQLLWALKLYLHVLWEQKQIVDMQIRLMHNDMHEKC